MHTVKVGNTLIKIYHWKGKNGYQQFKVSYHEHGELKRKTFGTLAKAKAHASEIAVQIERGDREALKLTNSDRSIYLHAIELLRPTKIPLHVAIEEYAAARSHLGGESLLSAAKEYAHRHQHSDKPVGEVVDELLAAKKRDGLSLRYIQTLRGHLKNRFAVTFKTNIGSVSSKMISEYLAAQKIGLRARNNHRNSIACLFEYARRQGYLAKHQHTEAEDVGRAKENGGEIGILSPKELAKLLSKADEEAALYLVLGAFTGLRSAELIRLEWEDLKFDRGYVVVGKHKSKTATRRLVPIQPNLMQWLAPYRGFTGRVFSSEHAADRTIEFAKSVLKKWPNNALRHSFATYRLAATHDAAKVALEMGNSPAMLFRNYRELADEHEAKAWFGITPKRPKNVVQLRKTAAA